MSILRGARLPRILMGIWSVLLVALVLNTLQSIVADGPSSDSIMMLVFSTLVALTCMLAAFVPGIMP